MDTIIKDLAAILLKVQHTAADEGGRDIDIGGEIMRLRKQTDALRRELAESREAAEKLQAFKDFVHSWLDKAGVEKDPESPHKAAGCRIGGRLDILIEAQAELAEARKELHGLKMGFKNEKW